jgi:hypothetical protein
MHRAFPRNGPIHRRSSRLSEHCARYACILSRHISSRNSRSARGGLAGGIEVVSAPKNGTVRTEGSSSLIYSPVYSPAAGFVGQDSMIVRMKYAGGRGDLVQFAISVR